MAMTIKAIPTLKGEEAKRFNKEAENALRERKTSKGCNDQITKTREVLKKANML